MDGRGAGFERWRSEVEVLEPKVNGPGLWIIAAKVFEIDVVMIGACGPRAQLEYDLEIGTAAYERVGRCQQGRGRPCSAPATYERGQQQEVDKKASHGPIRG